jgi:hypothetical protein
VSGFFVWRGEGELVAVPNFEKKVMAELEALRGEQRRQAVRLDGVEAGLESLCAELEATGRAAHLNEAVAEPRLEEVYARD